MTLNARPFNPTADFEPVLAFLQGRQPWSPLPPYWYTGRSRIALYLTRFEGRAENHQLWIDDSGQIQAYTYLSPDQNTPIYYTPEVREWRLFLHPEQRASEQLGDLIQAAEAALAQRASQESLTTVAYDSDLTWIALLEAHGYTKQDSLEVYMTRSLSQPIPAPTIPAGFVVRPFAGEAETISRAILTDSAFGGFEGPGEWSLTNVGRMIRFCQQAGAIDFVAATTDGTIASAAMAFCDSVTKLGEFDPVGTHQNYQRQGLAKAALLTGLHWMKGAGMETVVIRTDTDNIAAQRAYESIGFQTVDQLFRYQKRP